MTALFVDLHLVPKSSDVLTRRLRSAVPPACGISVRCRVGCLYVVKTVANKYLNYEFKVGGFGEGPIKAEVMCV